MTLFKGDILFCVMLQITEIVDVMTS